MAMAAAEIAATASMPSMRAMTRPPAMSWAASSRVIDRTTTRPATIRGVRPGKRSAK
jgi:hypothetical protein